VGIALGVSALVGLTVLAYVPALSGGFIWDDDDYVSRNAAVRSEDGLARIWFDRKATPQYYPLVFTTFWVEHKLWKLDPLGYHLDNVLLHALGAALLWAVLRQLSVPGAWVAAAVFAVHPVQVESVAWITERKNVLSGIFYMGAVLLYLRFSRIGTGALERSWGWYVLAMVLFVGALLSKSVTCSLPAAIVLLLWWKRGRVRLGDLAPLAPFFVVGVAAAGHTAWLEKHHVGTFGEEWVLGWLDRWLIAGRAVWFYVGKLLWPTSLTFSYPRWDVSPAVWWQHLFPLTAVGVVAALWLVRGYMGRGPLVGVLYFGGTLVPALGFIDVYPFRYSFVADHFQYLASAGMIALVVALLARGWRGLAQAASSRSAPWLKSIRVMVMAATLCLLAGLTWQQCKVYRSLETLWRDTLTKNPSSWLAHLNLSVELRERGELREALALATKAVDLAPRSVEAQCGLAVALLRYGRADEAVVHLERARDLAPDVMQTRLELGRALLLLGRLDEAEENLRVAVSLAPADVRPHFLLGTVLGAQERWGEAAGVYREVLRLRPGHSEAYAQLAAALAKQAADDDSQ
jgi:Flp pilus assembly protein TadD